MPRGRDGLEEPDEHAAAFLAVVPVALQILDDRQITMHPRHRLGEQVVVLRRLQGDVNTDGAGELTRPQAAGEYDGLRFDGTCVRDDTSDTSAGPDEARHGDTLDDGRAAHSSALGQRHRDADGIRSSLVRHVRSTDEVIDACERKELRDLRGGDDLIRNAETDLKVSFANQGLHALSIRGNG